jgi:citrate lyase subunit beta/citryl-CoA lyase
MTTSAPSPVTSPVTSVIASARSFLFVPATRPERVARALASGADAVIVDLEDAVTPQDKPAARQQLAQAFAALDAAQRARLLVRINAQGTPWHEEDVAVAGQLAAQGLGSVMLPKSESARAVAQVAAGVGPTCALVALIESVAGLDAVNELARAPQVQRLAFGHLDFQADAGLTCDAQEAELVPVRLAIVLAARRAGLAAPVDGVTVDTQDPVRLQAEALRARRGGFTGKLCIHPAQVAVVNTAFMPTAAELDWACRVVAGFEANEAGVFSGVFSLDGKMVDAPVLLLAQRTLALAAGR